MRTLNWEIPNATPSELTRYAAQLDAVIYDLELDPRGDRLEARLPGWDRAWLPMNDSALAAANPTVIAAVAALFWERLAIEAAPAGGLRFRIEFPAALEILLRVCCGFPPLLELAATRLSGSATSPALALLAGQVAISAFTWQSLRRARANLEQAIAAAQ
jgi:hypothetical protein